MEIDEPNGEAKPAQFRACQICRQRKVKCILPPDHETCEYCQRHNLECLQILSTNKRKRQTTSQADLKARVEQLEEKLKLTQATSEVPQSASLPHYDPFTPSNQSLKQTVLEESGRTKALTTLPGTPFSPGDANNNRLETSSAHYASETSYRNRISPISNHNLQTLPPPNILPSIRNTQCNFSPSGPPNHFSPVLEGYNQHQRSPPQFSPSTAQLPPTYRSLDGRPDWKQEAAGQIAASTISMPLEVPAGASESLKDSATAETQPTRSMVRLVGPMAPFDREFYDLCIREGIATRPEETCAGSAKQWNRLIRVSTDAALPIYEVHIDVLPSASTQNTKNVAPEAVAQVTRWTSAYGDVLLETFKSKVLPRYGLAGLEEMRAYSPNNIAGRSLSLVCAIYALTAPAVTLWPLKKRMYLSTEFYKFATRELERDLIPVTLDTLRILVLLAEFPIQSVTPLLNSWALAHAFELRLNVDPEHWKISEEEKLSRRRLFWWAILSDRFFSVQQNAPSLESDFYDTEIPRPRSLSDQINQTEIEISDLLTKIVRSFYSVRGAKMVHNNVAAASSICVQFEQMIQSAQAKVSCLFPSFQSQSNTNGLAIAMLYVHLTVCTIMIHRPFYENSNLGLIESLEHHRKACSAASDSVRILQQLPDAYYTEHWPIYARHVIVTVMITLLREARLSPDSGMRSSAMDSLRTLSTIVYLQKERWYVVNFLMNLMALAKGLIGEGFVPESAMGESGGCVEEATGQSPWSTFELEQLATFSWDDLSQMFGMTAVAPDWLMNIGQS